MCHPHNSEKICYIFKQCDIADANKLTKVLDSSMEPRGTPQEMGPEGEENNRDTERSVG